MNRPVVIYARVLLGMAGCLTTLAGLAVCFLVGFLPIVQAVDNSDLAFALALGWLVGQIFACDFVTLLRQRARRRQSKPTATYMLAWDGKRNTWKPIS